MQTAKKRAVLILTSPRWSVLERTTTVSSEIQAHVNFTPGTERMGVSSFLFSFQTIFIDNMLQYKNNTYCQCLRGIQKDTQINK